MTTSGKCPFCGSGKVFSGSIEVGAGSFFLPDETNVPFWKVVGADGIAFEPSAHLCAQCGKLWADADPQDAMQFLKRFGSKEIKARLASLDTSGKSQPESPAHPEPPPG